MRSRSTWTVLLGAGLIAAMATVGFVLSRQAAGALEEELDGRLVAFARITAESLAAVPPGPARVALFTRTRDAAALENVFALDRDGRSLGDARAGVAPGTRYTALDVDPGALAEARAGRTALTPRIEIEGVPLKTACAPAPDGGVVVVDASPAFVARLVSLRRLPYLAAGLGFLAALVFALAIIAMGRRLEASIVASMKVERLALAGRLAAEVAHEIRNPLAILRGSLQLARRALDTGANAREPLEDLIEEVDRIDRLVDDMLSLSRDVVLRRTPCDLNAVAARAADLAEVGAGRPVIRALTAATVQLHADERRLRQALLALLLNAFETGPGSTVTLVTGAGAEGPWMEIADDGPGMDGPTLARVGDPFFTTKPGGTGLGLSVVRQIAAAHGGTLDIDSAPGAGTRMRLRLPPA